MHRINFISLKIIRTKLSTKLRKKRKINIRQPNRRRTQTLVGYIRTK